MNNPGLKDSGQAIPADVQGWQGRRPAFSIHHPPGIPKKNSPGLKKLALLKMPDQQRKQAESAVAVQSAAALDANGAILGILAKERSPEIAAKRLMLLTTPRPPLLHRPVLLQKRRI